MQSTTRRVPSARERLLSSAGRLFRERGINATGIDLIVRDAEVAKASLYNNFASKEALVVSYLEQELDAWVTSTRALDDVQEPRAVRVVVVFEAIALAVEGRTFFGCPFTNAVIELPECANVRIVADRYRAAVRTHFSVLAGVDAAGPTASRLVLLYDAAIAAAKVGRDAALVREAGMMAGEVARSATAPAGFPQERMS